MPPNSPALCWSTLVRVCPLSEGGLFPVVAWAIHVSVGKQIERVYTSGRGERGNEYAAGRSACSTYICLLVEVTTHSTILGSTVLCNKRLENVLIHSLAIFCMLFTPSISIWSPINSFSDIVTWCKWHYCNIISVRHRISTLLGVKVWSTSTLYGTMLEPNKNQPHSCCSAE